ncbi:MAG: 5-methylthioadenosine/S-adenosylhomocysteine nucleosidase [Fibrobacteres bacterium]|nr:5-methylthioadenosine/S-adenosylhomocysteine nucleosidase [Fibrobacterota bacterium]
MTPDRIGIMGAMDAEITEFLGHADLIESTEWRGFTFHTVRLEGREAVLVKSGIGKVFSALVSQHLIDAFAPEALIFTGVAGALNPAYEIGDVVISRDCIQHDVDGRALGFARGNLLYTDLKIFAADPDLARIALSADAVGHNIRSGRILTGDQFMTRDQINHHRYLVDELHGDAVEMEGGAMAQVCAVNGIPFVVVRTISDRADGDAVEDFNRFLPEVARNSFAIVRHILSRLPRSA